MNIKKVVVLTLVAIIFALIAYVVAQNAQITAEINNVFEVVVNNTNLAPNVAGHPFGTGERLTNVTYWANTTPIEIFLFSHADTSGQDAGIVLNINGTNVSQTQTRPIAVAENVYTHLEGIIPKGSNYTVYFTNYHHYEWREYSILAGKNGTLSINQTISQNVSVSDAQLNLKVNKSGNEVITGEINISNTSTSLNVTFNTNFQNSVSTGISAGVVFKEGTGLSGIIPSVNARDIDFWTANSAGSFRFFGNPETNKEWRAYDSIAKTFYIGIINDGTKSYIRSKSDNVTLIHPKPIVFQFEYRNSTKYTAMTINNNTNITINILSGTGNAAVCIDSTGNLFRSTNASSNYLSC